MSRMLPHPQRTGWQERCTGRSGRPLLRLPSDLHLLLPTNWSRWSGRQGPRQKCQPSSKQLGQPSATVLFGRDMEQNWPEGVPGRLPTGVDSPREGPFVFLSLTFLSSPAWDKTERDREAAPPRTKPRVDGRRWRSFRCPETPLSRLQPWPGHLRTFWYWGS